MRSFIWIILFSAMTLFWAPSTAVSSRTEILETEKLIALDTRSATFRHLNGKKEGNRVRMSLEPSNGQPSEWILAFENLYRLFIYRSEQGAIRINRLEILTMDKAIVFSPPVEMIPPKITAGEQRTTDGAAAIHHLGTGREERTGDYSFTIEDVNRADFNVPGGEVAGFLLDYRYKIDLAYASSLRIDLETGWSGKQLVYWRSRTTLQKLGFFGETKIVELIADDFKEAG